MSKTRERLKELVGGLLGLLIWGLIIWGVWSLGAWGWPRLRDGTMALWQSAVRRTPTADTLPAEAGRKLNAGLSAAAAGQWSEAASLFDAARRLAPEEPEILFHQATAEYHLPGRMVRSYALYQAFLALAPDARNASMARERSRELEQRWDAFQSRLLTGLMKANERLGPTHTSFNYEWSQLAQASAQLGFADIALRCLQQRTDARGHESSEVFPGLVRAGKAAEAERLLATAPAVGNSDGGATGKEYQFEELACSAVERGDFETAKKWSAKITDPTARQRLAGRIDTAASGLLNRQLYANNLTAAIGTVEEMGEGTQRVAAQRELAKQLVWELEHIYHAKDAAAWKDSINSTSDGGMGAIHAAVLAAWREAVKQSVADHSIKDRLRKAIQPAGPPKDANGLRVSEHRKRLARLWLRQLNDTLNEPVFTNLADELKRAAQSDKPAEVHTILYQLSRWSTGKVWVQQHVMWFGKEPSPHLP